MLTWRVAEPVCRAFNFLRRKTPPRKRPLPSATPAVRIGLPAMPTIGSGEHSAFTRSRRVQTVNYLRRSIVSARRTRCCTRIQSDISKNSTEKPMNDAQTKLEGTMPSSTNCGRLQTAGVRVWHGRRNGRGPRTEDKNAGECREVRTTLTDGTVVCDNTFETADAESCANDNGTETVGAARDTVNT